jgi:hypothetical protein
MDMEVSLGLTVLSYRAGKAAFNAYPQLFRLSGALFRGIKSHWRNIGRRGPPVSLHLLKEITV